MSLRYKEGFTLLEFLIFTGIFMLVTIGFISILTSVLRVQSRQTSVAEVTQQSEFVLQQVQQLVEQSSLVELASDSPTGTLKLRMPSSTVDPTLLYVLSGTVYIQQGTSTAQPLTSSKVIVSNLTFTKRANVPGHDSVSVVFSMEYNTPSVPLKFAQALSFSAVRVSAATFDSNVVPSTDATLKLGASSQTWSSINDVVYFSGNNVGIGAVSPAQTLELNGGMRLNTTNSQPSCTSAQRGTFWAVQGAGGVKDSVQVCVKNASDTYLWYTIY